MALETPTDEQKQERIEFVAELMVAGRSTGDIKREFRGKYGDCSHVTVNRYMFRARENLAKDTEHSHASAAAYVREKCKSFIEGEDARAGVAALKLYADIHGLTVTRIQGSIQHDHAFDVSKLSGEQAAQLLELMERAKVDESKVIELDMGHPDEISSEAIGQ